MEKTRSLTTGSAPKFIEVYFIHVSRILDVEKEPV